MRWRREHSRLCYSAGAYRPHEEIVAEAAELANVPSGRAAELVDRLTRLEPWPEARAVLEKLHATTSLGVVTNCSEEEGRLGSARIGVPFDVVVTAEAAGAYKPRPEPYRLALEVLGFEAARTLFVAGSPDDIAGAQAVGMQVYWHNRRGLELGDRPRAETEHDSLEPLLAQ